MQVVKKMKQKQLEVQSETAGVEGEGQSRHRQYMQEVRQNLEVGVENQG